MIIIAHDPQFAYERDLALSLQEYDGGEALNTLHLMESDVSLAVDEDLRHSTTWMGLALAASMDHTRV